MTCLLGNTCGVASLHTIVVGFYYNDDLNGD